MLDQARRRHALLPEQQQVPDPLPVRREVPVGTGCSPIVPRARPSSTRASTARPIAASCWARSPTTRGPKVWALEIAPYDTAERRMITTLFDAVKRHAFFGPALAFHPTSAAVEAVAKRLPATSVIDDRRALARSTTSRSTSGETDRPAPLRHGRRPRHALRRLPRRSSCSIDVPTTSRCRRDDHRASSRRRCRTSTCWPRTAARPTWGCATRSPMPTLRALDGKWVRADRRRLRVDHPRGQRRPRPTRGGSRTSLRPVTLPVDRSRRHRPARHRGSRRRRSAATTDARIIDIAVRAFGGKAATTRCCANTVGRADAQGVRRSRSSTTTSS